MKLKVGMSVAVALMMVFQIMGAGVADASGFNKGVEVTSIVIEEGTGSHLSEDLVQPQALTSVAIFFGGVLMGYVVDGVVVYTTGKSGAEWVKAGLTNMETKIKNFAKSYKTGSVNVSNSGGLSYASCVTFPCQLQ